MEFAEERQKVTEIAWSVFSRGLTNTAGGNIACRVDDDLALITPTGSGPHWFWDLEPDDLLLVRISNGAILEGTHELSRETPLHLSVMRHLTWVGATIHAHPRSALVFAVCQMEIPVVVESSLIVGNVPVIEKYLPGTTPEFQEQAAAAIVALAQTRCPEKRLAVLLPAHGVFVAGTTIVEAFDTLERVEVGASCIINAAALRDNPLLEGPGPKPALLNDDAQT